MARLRLGVDIGGTFTDHVLFDEERGAVEAIKTPSTPDDLSRCVLDGVRRFGRRPGGISGLDLIAHGTTVNTNAILERRGARCGLIATRGFRDILEIGRQTRPDFYRWFVDRPAPLVPRHLRLEVEERVDTNGTVLVPLVEEDVLEAVEHFRDADVQSVAISLINAFANPIHERRIREILEATLDDTYISVSSELCPEFREFERTSTAAAAAYVGPLFQRYVDRLGQTLESEIVPVPRLFIMQSSGGMASAVTAVTRPHVTIESGPAAGVVATAELGRRLGLGDLISFDMGGTTAKACLVRGGTPEMVNMLEVGGEASGFFGVRITGLPIKAPSIDLVECSAGGGSIAWVDVAGLLKVGPESAGAVPGPACYASGGIRPTVTDAHVALGRIGAATLLGGEMEIRPDLATEAIRSRIASRIDLPVDEAAQGVLDVVNAEMVRILRVVSVTRGFDPRRFTLVAYGGAGPLHAGDLAEELGIERIVVPPNPGVFSAMGLLASDVEVTASVTRRTRASPDDLPAIRSGLAEVENECTARLDQEQIPESERTLLRLLEMRYVRQNFELEIAVPDGMVSADSLARVLTDFHEAHQRTYGHSDAGDPAEIVNFKARGIGQVKRPRLREVAAGTADPGGARTGTRPVYFRGSGWTSCPNYARGRLLAGNRVQGPAVINAFDSTALLRPGQAATVNEFGDLIITRGEPGAG